MPYKQATACIPHCMSSRLTIFVILGQKVSADVAFTVKMSQASAVAGVTSSLANSACTILSIVPAPTSVFNFGSLAVGCFFGLLLPVQSFTEISWNFHDNGPCLLLSMPAELAAERGRWLFDSIWSSWPVTTNRPVLTASSAFLLALLVTDLLPPAKQHSSAFFSS